MGFIKNYDSLNKSPQREIVLDLIEAGLEAIQPENVFSENFKLDGAMLTVLDHEVNLANFERIFLLGFGKGSAMNCSIIERMMGDKISAGFDIDVVDQSFNKIEYTKGTHPLPSQENIDFTKKVVEKLSNLGNHDLVIIVTCGGGSALLELPYSIPLEKLISVNSGLLKSGANIHDMNVVRKHLSQVKGGGLAKILYPAKVLNLVFSDVPGNDLTVIASAPTVLDPTTKAEAWEMFMKFGLAGKVDVGTGDFVETPKDKEVFANVENIILLSNLTALNAMRDAAAKLGINAQIYSDHFQGEAKEAGEELVKMTQKSSAMLVGGETTVTVSGQGGEGGRNQELVLGVLAHLTDEDVIASFDSDGWDNSAFASAIGDKSTLLWAGDLNLDPSVFLNRNDTFNFFRQVGDGIEAGRLPSNVSDLAIVLKK